MKRSAKGQRLCWPASASRRKFGVWRAFGFERGDHYDVGVKAGERVLLPAVRGASPDTLIVADGFSCRVQIAQLTGREALYPAQVLQMALRGGTQGAIDEPEREFRDTPAKPNRGAAMIGAGLAPAGAAVAIGARQRSDG